VSIGPASSGGQQTGGETDVRRDIGVFTATSIVVANIIGAGIFTTSGILAGLLPGPGWVLLCWLVGGAIAIAGSLCYAELATRMPEEGAEYVYLKRLFHPSLGFLTGWTSFIVGFSAAIAASAMGFSEYLFAGLDGAGGALGDTGLFVAKKATAVAIIVAFTALHYTGIRKGAGVQNFLTVLKVVMVLGLAVAGIALGGGKGVSLFAESGGAGDDGFRWLGVGTAMLLIMFAYSGWNASAYIAGELRNPRRTLPVSLVVGTSIVIVLYLAVNLFIFRSVPFAEANGVIAIVERATVGAFGDWMGNGLSVMISLALLSSLSAYILIGPRVYFAMARDRLFLPFAGRLHKRYHVPGTSILLQGGIAASMVSIGSFEQLLLYLGFALGIFPWLAVAGLFVARRRRIGESTAVKVPGYPVVPLFFLATTAALMVVAFINRPFESSAAVLTVLAGVPCYLIWIRAVAKRRD
jgi:APA family basic amino acid/polyamine antiporter